MARCESWKPVVGTHPAGHLPGECRVCWKPCRAHVKKPAKRCEACTDALLYHPDYRVRKELATEAGQDPDILKVLLSDKNGGVRMLAENALRDAGVLTTTPPAGVSIVGDPLPEPNANYARPGGSLW